VDYWKAASGVASTSHPIWKVRRLLAMSPAEVGLRLVRGVADRRRRPGAPAPQAELASAESVLCDGVRSGGAGAAGVSDWIAGELDGDRGRLLPGARDAEALTSALRDIGRGPEAVVDAAIDVLEGRVSAFGWTSFDVGPSPDWHRDPDSGGVWPRDYWADVDFRGAEGLGDPRYVWELNRHHHLVTLGRAHVLTGEARFAERVWRDVTSWIDTNPPLFGVNWSSPLEIAIRLMSWAMALDLVGANGAQPGDAANLATSVSLQGRHLSDNLTVYASSRNNHLLGEASGLLVAGAKFRFLRDAGRQAGRGRALLERELRSQVTADGVTREQAFQYQVFVMEFALLGVAAARALGTSLAPDCVERLGRMAQFLGAVSGAGGVPPSIGDGDGGRAYELADGFGRQAAGAIAASAVAAGLAPLDRYATDLESALWLLGTEPVVEASGKLAASGGSGAVEVPSPVFADGGYFVTTNGTQRGVVDCGPLGYLSIAAHGHADCLSLVVSDGVGWVLVDPGTYCYHRDALWRDHFRSTAAHNTVSVNGRSQSDMLGPFMWGRRAGAAPLVWVSAPGFDYFEGEHDGFKRSDGVVHRRSVLFSRSGYWLIVDHLEGRGQHRVDGSFQLAEGYSRLAQEGPPDGSAAGDELVFTSGAGRSVSIRSWLPEGMFAHVVEGSEDPPRGWVSSGFGHKAPAPAVVESGMVDLPVTLLTAIVPLDGAGSPRVRCATGGWSGGAVFEIDTPRGRETVLMGTPQLETAGWSFSGTLGFLFSREDGAEASGLGIDKWMASGSDVAYERLANLLSGL
jgi:hypothetical protein